MESYMGRYASLEILVECPKCGDKTPINGPKQHPVCDNCDYRMTVYPSFWETVLENLENCHNELSPRERNNMTISDCGGKITYSPEEPACLHCHTLLPVSTVNSGFDGKVECTSCGKAVPTYPPPELLEFICPALRQIFGGEPDATPKDAVSLSLSQESDVPISMKCPNCGAGLIFPCTTTRRTTCCYCTVDVFIPDALWRRLHPVQKSEKWYLRFIGPPRQEVQSKSETSNLFAISMLLTILAGAAALIYVIC